MAEIEKDTHSGEWMSIENARRALEMLVSRPGCGVFFEMELLVSEKDEKVRRGLEELYTYALNLAVEFLRRAEWERTGEGMPVGCAIDFAENLIRGSEKSGGLSRFLKIGELVGPDYQRKMEAYYCEAIRELVRETRRRMDQEGCPDVHPGDEKRTP